VGVIFEGIPKESFFIGGRSTAKFVRISIDHLARSELPTELEDWWIENINAVLAPFVKDRGFDWEFHIDETIFDLWSIQGLRPPPPDSEHEKRWQAENKLLLTSSRRGHSWKPELPRQVLNIARDLGIARCADMRLQALARSIADCFRNFAPGLGLPSPAASCRWLNPRVLRPVPVPYQGETTSAGSAADDSSCRVSAKQPERTRYSLSSQAKSVPSTTTQQSQTIL
jgi:Putative oxalocrotonate tautomerase enzyme